MEIEHIVLITEKEVKALDKKLDFIVNFLSKEAPKSWAQVAATPLVTTK